jgi:pimeloyl-ACP methyl ester carboxylesterase
MGVGALLAWPSFALFGVRRPGLAGILCATALTVAVGALAGFDVYAYDQIGAGRSARLADVKAYTVARHVADLEAIRTTIGAEKIVLIGNSWGGTLAANYLAAHPEHGGQAGLVVSHAGTRRRCRIRRSST